MKLSLYTSVQNGIYLDFHLVHMLRHHIALADEIVVNEGYSGDDTYERISNLHPKIKVYRMHWDRSQPGAWHRNFGNKAKALCTGDWCIKLDCDEFIPEWEFDNLRKMIERTNKSILPLRLINFYGNYKVFNRNPERSKWPEWKYVIHRNTLDAEVVGDGSNVVLKGEEWDAIPENAITCHHFGAVRHAARLRQKWRNDGSMKRLKPAFDRLPRFLYDIFPHNWLDPDLLHDLSIYEGPFVAAVREDPDEFIRDHMRVYDFLKKN